MIFMPVYHYTPIKTPCKLCGDGFDSMHAANETLTRCPTCGQGVTRANVHRVNTAKLTQPLSVSDAKNAGFTVLKRISSGEFEKQ